MIQRNAFLIPLLLAVLAGPAWAEGDLPVVIMDKLPVGRLAFVTGNAFGSTGTITVVGQDGNILPFDGNKPEFVPHQNAILFSNHSQSRQTIFMRELSDNRTSEIDVDQHDADSPSLSPSDGKLAFVAWPKERKFSHIYLDDGDKFVPLTKGEHYNWSPHWSPDGKKIVFESTRDGERQIYVMDANGENQTNLCNNKILSHAPNWSPDGNHIAYMSVGDNKKCNIFIMKKDGSDKQNISQGTTRDSEPVWSPNGEWLAFTRTTNGPPKPETMNIWIMKRDGSEQQQVTRNKTENSSYNPTWAN